MMKTNTPTAVLMTILLGAPAFAVVNVQTNPDGAKYTSVLLNGTAVDKYDIVFLGDGFTASEQGAFNIAVDDAVGALQTRVPFSQRMCAFNIWRVNVVSNESGVDHPKDGIFKDTELNCRYGNPDVGETERCIRSDTPRPLL